MSDSPLMKELHSWKFVIVQKWTSDWASPRSFETAHRTTRDLTWFLVEFYSFIHRKNLKNIPSAYKPSKECVEQSVNEHSELYEKLANTTPDSLSAVANISGKTMVVDPISIAMLAKSLPNSSLSNSDLTSPSIPPASDASDSPDTAANPKNNIAITFIWRANSKSGLTTTQRQKLLKLISDLSAHCFKVESEEAKDTRVTLQFKDVFALEVIKQAYTPVLNFLAELSNGRLIDAHFYDQ